MSKKMFDEMSLHLVVFHSVLQKKIKIKLKNSERVENRIEEKRDAVLIVELQIFVHLMNRADGYVFDFW